MTRQLRTRSGGGRRSAARSLLRLRPHLRRVRGRLVLAVVLAIMASGLGLAMPLVLKWLVDGPLTSGDRRGIWLGGAVLMALGAAEAAIFGIRRRLTARPLAEVEASMREALYRRLQRLPIAFHDRWSSGQLLSRGIADLGLVRGWLSFPLPFLAVNAVTFVAGGAILLAQQWMLGLMLLAPAVPLILLYSWFRARHVPASRRAQDLNGDLTTFLEEAILGIRVIKGFGRHDTQTRAFRERVREVRAVELHKARLLAALSGMFVALPEIAVGATLTLGVVQVADGTVSAGTVLAFLTTALVLLPVIESTGGLLAVSNQAATAADRYHDIMDEPAPAEERTPGAGPATPAGPAALAFENVRLRYPGAAPDAPEVLRGVDLRIEPGETMALAGSTGSGKTALLGLVPRLYEPTGGRITLDGRDIAGLSRSRLRAMVAVAFEDPALFSGSVMDNVLMGAEAATEADGARALRVAQADGFVDLLPSGAHTQVGEQGSALSGGERQRLALARAVVGRPRLLVLDDPLSALDIHTEAAVERALRHVLATTTALIVAHRPSTALLADRVALLHDGRVAAVGTHRQLLRTHPEYARLTSPDPFARDLLPVPEGASRALLASLVRPHRRLVVATGLLLVVQRAIAQSGPLLVALAIDRAVPAFRAHDNRPLLAVCLGYLLFAVASGGLQYAFVRASARVGQDVIADLLGRIFLHAQALGIDFHERYTSGRLTSRATSDVQALRTLLGTGLQDIVGASLTTVYLSALLLWLDWPLGLAAVAVGGPLALTVRAFRRRAYRVYSDRSTATAAVTAKYAETLTHIRPVQTFRLEESNDRSFARINRRHARVTGDADLVMARYVTSSRLVANAGIAVLVTWGAFRVSSGGLELGVFAAIVLYLRRLYDDPLKLGGVLDAYQSAVASLEKIAALLAQPPSVPEPARPRPLPPGTSGRPGRAVVFEQVAFAYHTGGEVLPRFDLTLAPGQIVAVVGATGAGKTTLAKLLARFADPTHGRVLLDGVDLRHLATADLRRAVVMVTQEAFLFSATIAANIALGRPDAGRARIEQVARAVGAHEFITGLPDGYDTGIRAGGHRISAGQRQLVALARALLADPSVVILDEATASLDLPGERLVQRAMRTVLRGRTALVTAHRLSTVHIADRVLVMDGGRIVEDGTPGELLDARGRFAELHAAWRDSLS